MWEKWAHGTGLTMQVLIIDDHSDIPVEWDPKETRVRIIRNGSSVLRA